MSEGKETLGGSVGSGCGCIGAAIALVILLRMDKIIAMIEQAMK